MSHNRIDPAIQTRLSLEGRIQFGQLIAKREMFCGIFTVLVGGSDVDFVPYCIRNHFHDGAVSLKWGPNVSQNPENAY
jgi:hypothetical protein